MISYLRGAPIHCHEDSVIFCVQDVGYNVFMTERDISTAKENTSSSMDIWVETIMRENSCTFFGFLSMESLQWFRYLLLVPGVGGKMALSLLSCFPLEDLLLFIKDKKTSALCRAEGVGAKLAQRVVQELSAKVEKWEHKKSFSLVPSYSEEVIQGLCALGYSTSEAQKAWEALKKSPSFAPNMPIIDMIRLGLMHLSPLHANASGGGQ